MFRSSKPTGYTEVNPTPNAEDSATEELSRYEDGVPGIPDDEQSSRQKLIGSKSTGRSVRESWRFVVTSGALAGSLILLINVITLIVVYIRFDTVDHASLIYEGSCSTTNQVSIGSHIIINVLSTILLAYSNYGMQCVSAPTRAEIDKAHGRRRWLSIGTPTIRNLLFVSRWKSCLWIWLFISSFPLHLVWNSTVFQTQVSNDYFAISVTPDVLYTSNSVLSLNESIITSSYLSSSILGALGRFQNLMSQPSSANLVERLDVGDCIKAYSTDLMSTRRHLLMVVDAVNVTSSDGPIVAAYSNSDIVPFLWMCDSSYTMNVVHNGGGWSCPDKLLAHVAEGQSWIPGQTRSSDTLYGGQNGNPVQYCYSEKIEPKDQHCKVSIVPVFLIIVVICNVMKIVGFVLCLRATRKNPPILTTGDAIASFLDTPDDFTKGRCLASKYDYDKVFARSREWQPRPEGTFDIWEGGRYRWGKAIRGIQWTFYMLCASTVIMLAGAFFGPGGIGSGTTKASSSTIRLGIGKPHKNFTIGYEEGKSLLVKFLAANVSQLVVSYMYLFLSNMFTTMAAMAEFCSFSQTARGLRVSAPQKGTAQKSSYFLSLPYRYAVPLMASIAALHYFVSQMVFLARIDVYDQSGDLDTHDSTTEIFFSPLAMLVSVSIASAIVLILIVVGIFKKYPSTSLAGCCSASIAAACQPPFGQSGFSTGLALEKLQWGVVSHDQNGVGHATFSTGEVKQLLIEHGYA